MCGITGIITKHRVALQVLQRMTDVLAHRGPDGCGLWVSDDQRLGFGHRRLSILDLSERGRQPMLDVTGRWVLTFNGEIYNYVEVRAELQAAGVAFRTGTDTEVILEAYKTWGMKCLQRFNGMFAFALYDSDAAKLFCARDRYGEKPFLFHAGPDRFSFASEYKALLADPEVPVDVDELRLMRGLHNASTGLDADSETVFKEVRQLRPAEMLELDTGTLRYHVSRYWQPEIQPEYARLSEPDAVDRFRDLLTDSIRLRMRSDVAVGSCLSGGLDSSAIVCLVRTLVGADHPYHCFTGRFPGTSADEWAYAREVVAQTGVISHTVEPTAEGFLAELPDFIWHNELPVGSSSQYAQWCVFRLAKEQGVTVLLDGQGADELLGGYEQYFGDYVAALQESGDGACLATELPEIHARYPLALTPAGRAWRDRAPLRLRHAVATWTGRGSNFLFGVHPDLAATLAEANARPRDMRFNPLASALAQDSFGRFLTTLLRYGDRNSMAHSREVRLPFCDHRLAELALSLPPQYLMGGAQTKRLLRESMKGILPETIRTRWNKQGFRPPQDLWFRGDLFRAVQEVVHDPSFARSGVWNARWWRAAMRRMRAGRGSMGWVLWHPLMWMAWQRHFVDRVRELRGVRSGVETAVH